jgi:hypothetical protein
MIQVTQHEFCKTICEDFGIELKQKHKTNFNQFPIKNGKRKINSSHDAIIVDRQGNEHPYMINQTVRNEEKLIDFDYIYIIRAKQLEQVLEETGLKLESKPCKICEGGGWYSKGIKYFYKDITCEI